MKQIDLDSNLESPEFEEQTLPDDVLEALGAGRLTEIEYLGSGATSSVFSAHDSSLDKKIAIKFLKHANENRLVNFQTEAKLASKLNHDNLVRILNFGVTKKNHAFLIMEFVDGKSLEQILEEVGRIPIEIAIPLLSQICDGLAHSHGKKISHRDLKTANILVQGYGTGAMKAIVVDFGLAQERQTQDKSTQGSSSGKIKGSPLFISPEQAQGKHGDERSDIYSLGCITFNMLTGALPFYSDELFDLLRLHIEEPAPTLSEYAVNVEFPPALESCVQRMLEKSPEKRFQTIQEVKDSLRRSIRIQTQVPSQASQVVPRRFRRSLLLVCLIVAVAAGVVYKNTALAPPATPIKTKKVETPEAKFDRLFKYDTGHFLSHYHHLFVCPKVTGLITDDDIACLARVRLATEDINLAFTNIKGTGLAKLKSIHGLKLDLSKTEMTEDGFKEIGKLQNLRALALMQAKVSRTIVRNGRKYNVSSEISDKETAEIAKAKKLLELNLDMCRGVDDKCFQTLSSLPLILLTAKDAGKITDVGALAVAQNKNLQMIHLDGSQITDKSVDALGKLGGLIDFRANRCKMVTGKSLPLLLKRNPKLQFLGMSFTQTTTADLHCLEGRDMVFLELLGIPMGTEEIKMFGNMRNMDTMYLSHVSDPESLKFLYQLKNATRLAFLDSPKLDAKSLSMLQEQLPQTQVWDGQNRAARPDVQDFAGMYEESSSDKNPFEI